MRPGGTWCENILGREAIVSQMTSSYAPLTGVTRDTKALNATQKLRFLPQLCQILRTQAVGNQTGKKLLGEKL